MTEEDAKLITTGILKEHKEARTRLSCLRSKARRMAILLRETACALEEVGQSSNESTARLPLEADVELILKDIQATKQKIVVLESEIEAQGFGEYIPAKGKVMPAGSDD